MSVMLATTRAPVLAPRHALTRRQLAVLGHLVEQGSLTIRTLEALVPGVSRRTLQRDLKLMVEKRVLVARGATDCRVYRLALGVIS